MPGRAETPNISPRNGHDVATVKTAED